MKKTRNVFKSILVAVMALGLSYCGSTTSGTGGSALSVVDDSGNTVIISVPEIEASRSSNDVTIYLSVEDGANFSHFEVERKVGSAPFAYMDDNATGVLQDLDKTNNTYRYRAKAVYVIDGSTHFSALSDEDAVTVGPLDEAQATK